MKTRVAVLWNQSGERRPSRNSNVGELLPMKNRMLGVTSMASSPGRRSRSGAPMTPTYCLLTKPQSPEAVWRAALSASGWRVGTIQVGLS